MYCYGYKLIWKPGSCLFVGYFFLTRPIISHKMSQRTCTATAINWSESQVAVCLLVIFFWPVPLLVTKCHKERTEWLITSSGAVFSIFSHEKTHHVLVQTYGFANFASGLMWIGARLNKAAAWLWNSDHVSFRKGLISEASRFRRLPAADLRGEEREKYPVVNGKINYF